MAWWIYLLIFLAVILFLLNISRATNYYVKMVFYYVSILFHGIECMVTMIPSYFRCAGADLIFYEWAYWCFWTGIKYDVRGYEEHLAPLDEPAVVIANHQSSLDVISMANTWPARTVVMMKKSLDYVPFFNVTSWMAHSIYVDRFNKEKATATIDHTVEQLKTKNHKLWVFPEGTRNYKGGLLPFKKGAFNIAVRAQIPIVPIVFSEYKPFYSRREKYFYSDGLVIAEVLPPIQTKGMSPDDVDKLAEDTREQMLKVLNRISLEAKAKIEEGRKKKAV